ncbi:MAG: homogentisate 1,2-dioxygenase, partial [Sphingobacteriia bacterium]
MPHYQFRGTVPPKRHTVMRQPNGALYQEELVSTEGFSNIYSLVYHVHPPTMVKHIGAARPCGPDIDVEHNMQSRSYMGFQVAPADDYIKSRKIMLANADVQILLAAPRRGTEGYFFKNASADEVVFVHRGSGTLKTPFGSLTFSYGDYLHIPRGVVHQFEFDTEDNRLFIIESFTPVYFPKRYMNRYGQFEEHSPIYERDIRTPQALETHDEQGDFLIQIKKEHYLHPYTYATHPFDYAGWDGYFYPYIFSIHNFEPITGRLHLPPPIHQTFETNTFVICSFCPRLYDYHPQSIP